MKKCVENIRKYEEVCRKYGEVQDGPSSLLYIACGTWKNSELSPIQALGLGKIPSTPIHVWSVHVKEAKN